MNVSNHTFKWSSCGFVHIRFHLAVWLKLAERFEFSDSAAAWKNERNCLCWPPWKAQAAESTDSLLWEALPTSSGSCSSAAIWTRFAEWWSSSKDWAEGAKGGVEKNAKSIFLKSIWPKHFVITTDHHILSHSVSYIFPCVLFSDFPMFS